MKHTEEYNRSRRIWILLIGFCAAAAGVLILCMMRSASLPDYLGRELTGKEEREIIGRNSGLTGYLHMSPNADFPRSGQIRKLTIHHMAGNLSLEEAGELFSHQDRRTSANYGIDSNGKIALYVEESNRAWTSGSPENDNQSVTIEVANDEIGGGWHVSDDAYAALIDLCADICRRNNIQSLNYTGDADGNLTIHKMFTKDTECPGPYLESKMAELAEAVNARLAAEEK